MSQNLISIVIPCFNEEAVIAMTYDRLMESLSETAREARVRFELVFVDDGSRDQTLAMLHALAERHANAAITIEVVALSRNFGHQAALSAGYGAAKGDAVISMDADLQDPPEEVQNLIRKWREGADVVYAIRRLRQGETQLKLWTADIFYQLLRRLTQIDIPAEAGDFRLLDRRVVQTLNAMPETHRFVRGLIPWMGFKQAAIYYDRHARAAGVTKYPFWKMLAFAIDGVTSFSRLPLKASFLAGVSLALLSLTYAAGVVLYQLLVGFPVKGWASLMFAIIFLGGIQLIAIGILGEYVGRIYEEVKRRPLYIVDERAGKQSSQKDQLKTA